VSFAIGILHCVDAASFAATTAAPPRPCSWRGRIPRASRPETVTLPLCSRTNASPFWIMLLLVLGRPDNGMIRVILDRRRSDVLPCRNAPRPALPRNRVDVRIGRSWHVRMPVPFASRLETGSSVQSTFRSGMTSFLCHDHHAEIAGGCSSYDLDGGLLRQGGPVSGARLTSQGGAFGLVPDTRKN